MHNIERGDRRENAVCPNCRSLERHRHQMLVFRSVFDVRQLPENYVLHCSPEPGVAAVLKKAAYYCPLDTEPAKGRVAADLTSLPFAGDSFDVIWCSHVLEHIVEVERAVAEIHRVLKSDGVALLDVPILERKTRRLEVSSPDGHFWSPGNDWFDIYRAEGFDVEVFTATDEEAERFSINDEFNLVSKIAICRPEGPAEQRRRRQK